MLAPYVDVTAVLKSWRALQWRMRGHFGDEIYRQWLDEVTPSGINGDTLVLKTPHNLTGQFLVLQKIDQYIIQAISI